VSNPIEPVSKATEKLLDTAERVLKPKVETGAGVSDAAEVALMVNSSFMMLSD
jgi:predicted nucleic acid-binding protein